MIRNQPNQPQGANLVYVANGADFAGVVTVYVKGDTGAEVIGTVNAGIATAKGRGLYEYVPSAAETDFGHVDYIFTGPLALTAGVHIDTISLQQISALQTANGLGSVAAQVIVADALAEIRVARAGDVLEPDMLDFGMGKLNRLLDRWNADPRARFNVGFQSFVPTPNHQPHTLGPNAADWAVTQRPVKIQGANLILNTVTPAVRVPLTIRDDGWWLRQTVQGIATTMPTDLYYSPDWPNGSVFLWPIPTATYPIELMLDGLFGTLLATDTFWLPFGYRDAITLTLAEELAPGNGQTVAQSTRESATAARALIFGNNDDEPRIATADSGIPSGGGHGSRTTFNYRSRSFQ